MKVIPGPRATSTRFSFRVNSKKKITCTASDPAELKTDPEKLAGQEYLDAGLLQEFDPASVKKAKQPPKETGN